MKTLFALACCLLCTMSAATQAQDWVKGVGTEGFEYGYDILPTTDGGFMTLGTRSTTGFTNDLDFWVARFNAGGSKMWDSSYGTPGREETLFGSNVAGNGGFMLGGFTGKQFSGTESAHMYRIDSVGRVVWSIDLDYSRSDHFHFFTERKKGGYYFGGHTDSKNDPNGDMWLLRLGANRDTIWEKTYDRGTSEHAHSGIETRDGGVLLLGHTTIGGREKYWVVKVDSNGMLQWQKTYGTNTNFHDSPYRVFETAEGNFALIGGSTSAVQQDIGTMWLLVIDTTGKIVLDKHYGNANGLSFSQSGRQTSDGGYILAGYTSYATKGAEDMYVVKVDATGTLEWERKIGGSGPDYAYDIIEVNDGYIAAGYTGSGSLMTGGGGDLLIAKIAKPSAPVAPVLIAPRNDSMNVPVTAGLTWRASAGAVRYRIQAGTDSLFATTAFDDSTITGTSRILNGLLQQTRYWWRVRAINSAGISPWSGAWSFVTRSPLPLPAQVVLVSPMPDAVAGAATVKLVWQAGAPEIRRYWSEVATDSVFIASTVDSTSTDTSIVWSKLADGIYWWRVRAGNTTGWGPFSEARRFTVQLGAAVDADIIGSGMLLRNIPNPFVGTTTIQFAVAGRSHVTLEIIDPLGRGIAVLVNEAIASGEHSMPFDAGTLAAGTYFCRLSIVGSDGSKTARTIPITVMR